MILNIFAAVDNLERLLSYYAHDERVKKLVNLLRSAESPQRLLVNQLIGAQDCFVLSGLQKCGIGNHLIIAMDKEEAAYILNTLEVLREEANVSLFPDSFKRPRQFEEIDSHNILLRTEAVNRISLKKNTDQIVVTYPEALFEKVLDPRLLEGHRLELSKGEMLQLDTLLEVLIEYGFERVDFVYEPGQFSIRGGIVDIFSFGNEWPYRIELFDDEVESMRTFHPATQLSIRSISKLAIIPNVVGHFNQSHKVSIFDVMLEDAIIWVKDADQLKERLEQCLFKAEEFSKSVSLLEDDTLKEIFKERAFIYPDSIIESIGSKHVIFYRATDLIKEYNLQLSFGGMPQRSFNRKFELLIEDIRSQNKDQIESFLFSSSTKQIERFYSIFQDLQANIKFHPIPKAIHQGFVDPELKVACYTDHQIFERFHRYNLRRGFTADQAITLRMLKELQPGDFVVHIDHGIGKYSGLEKININGHIQESVRLFYKNNDVLYVGINSLHKISRYIGKDGTPPSLDKIGSDAWKTLKARTKKKVKDIAKELIQLYAKRKASEGFAFAPDGYLQTELEASFLYEDTPDQYNATVAVKKDMEASYPMDRLVCGDVGFGKTEVAIRAAFKAVVNGKQVAILVPTTILALQHYKTFTARMKDLPVTVEYINRFKSTAEKNKVFEELKAGKIDILIGTHAILNSKIAFKDLGLLVIDEEQKFGVAAKEKLRGMRVNVDTLILTATPIPRTLQFSLLNARDLSIMRTPPPNRQPIHTERRVFSDQLIQESIYYEVHRGGQVFFVHNRVKSLPDISALVKRLCPDLNIATAHGQMESKALESTLLDFIEGRHDVLICTNIIETGLDIPNANTMIINNAHQFGLSDLHQLRGRVGRSAKKAFCYLFTPPVSVLTAEARKRLKTLEEFSELGSGFNIAMKDLDIRGAGNLLGAEQSGFIADIGYETYQRILEEAVMELKETDYKDVFADELSNNHSYVRDVEIDTDVEMLIPDHYVNNIQERLSLYTQLDDIATEEELMAFRAALIDRFGKMPDQVEELFEGLRLRWIAKRLGFERIVLKNKTLKAFFLSSPQSSYFESELFKKLMEHISTTGSLQGISLKQAKNFLIMSKENVKSLRDARVLLERMREQIDHSVVLTEF